MWKRIIAVFKAWGIRPYSSTNKFIIIILIICLQNNVLQWHPGWCWMSGSSAPCIHSASETLNAWAQRQNQTENQLLSCDPNPTSLKMCVPYKLWIQESQQMHNRIIVTRVSQFCRDAMRNQSNRKLIARETSVNAKTNTRVARYLYNITYPDRSTHNGLLI